MTSSTILLIDDDSDLLQVMAQRCQQIGLQVIQARNLLTASSLIDKRVPEIVCIDVNMPTGNGLQFCEMLASEPKTADVPIIVLTGQRDAQTRQGCNRLGVHYVPKRPDAWNELLPLIQRLAAAAARPAQSQASGIRPRGLPPGLIPQFPEDIATDRPANPSAKQVVIADDDPDIVELLSHRLSSLGCSVIAASSALEAVNAIHRAVPDLVCLDVNMPSGNGLSVCEMMSSDPRLRLIPIIILTGCSDKSTIRRCHDMLVFYVQKGADVWSRVEPLVRELLRFDEQRPAAAEPKSQTPRSAEVAPHQAGNTGDAQENLMDAVFAMLGGDDAAMHPGTDRSDDRPLPTHDSEPPWVLSIDDDADFSDALRVRLEEHGVAVARAFNGMEGYRMAFTSPASAILLDYNMPNGQGDYVLDRLKNNPVTKDIPVIVLTGTKDKMVERRMMAMGAAGYFHKPVDFVELRDRLADHVDILARPVQRVPVTT